ncbi:MAG: bacterial proteasome activator family protein [Actinomycetota bacterium]|nr:bacterial proteasome activator family protein [Actinomycetota bacterium]
MSNQSNVDDGEQPLVVASLPEPAEAGAPAGGETIESPAKVLRIGSMTKELLEEVRRAPLDEAGRGRLREIYETSVRELAECISDDLRDELARLTSPFESSAPSDAELRVAQAQLVGWLEGLFHGIQAAMFSQQVAARAQMEEMRRRGLPAAPGPEIARPGNYL